MELHKSISVINGLTLGNEEGRTVSEIVVGIIERDDGANPIVPPS